MGQAGKNESIRMDDWSAILRFEGIRLVGILTNGEEVDEWMTAPLVYKDTNGNLTDESGMTFYLGEPKIELRTQIPTAREDFLRLVPTAQ